MEKARGRALHKMTPDPALRLRVTWGSGKRCSLMSLNGFYLQKGFKVKTFCFNQVNTLCQSVFGRAPQSQITSAACLDIWTIKTHSGLWIDSLENQNVSLHVRAHQAPSVDKILNAQQKTVDNVNVNRAFYWMPEKRLPLVSLGR